MEKEWQSKVYSAYFVEHLGISDAAVVGGVCRQTASSYIKNHPDYEKEELMRIEESRKRRKIRKRQWEFHNRIGINLKREHEMAVRILSSEKYH